MLKQGFLAWVETNRAVFRELIDVYKLKRDKEGVSKVERAIAEKLK